MYHRIAETLENEAKNNREPLYINKLKIKKNMQSVN